MAPKLIVEVLGDVSGLQKSLGRGEDTARGFGNTLGRLSVGFGQLAKGFVEIELLQKAFEGLHSALDLGIEGFTDTTRVAAQTAAVLKSTGDASNLSAKQVHSLAASLSNISGIDDEVVQSAENVLLSFTQIRDFAGKNNDIFTRATKVVTDYASRTGKSATTAATIIGRALADPATKAVALSRAGIVLTKSQLDALKAIEKTSGVVAAQKVLLGDLETRFKGAAAAAGDTFSGQLNVLRERFKDLAGELVGDVTPAFKGAVSGLRGFVVELTEAKGAHAKFDVVVDGLDDLGSKIKAQFDKVDFRGIASRLGTRLGDAIRSVNWKLEIEKAGKAAGAALAETFNGLSSVLNRVDWNKVGRVIVDGLGKAIGAVLVFLHSVDWKKVGEATFRLLVAGFKAQQEIIEGIGQAIGKALLDGIGRGLDAEGPAIEAKAIKVVLGIIDPFTSIPGFLGPEGGIARGIKASLHATLDSLNAPAAADGASVGEKFVAGVLGAFTKAQGSLAAAVKDATPLFTLGQPKGLVKPGNLDINHRPIVHNPGGSISTEESISIGVDGNEVLIPTVFGGKHHSDDQAIQHFQKTQENLGTFSSIKAANAYAVALHKRQDVFYHSILTAQKQAANSPTAKATADAVSQGLPPLPPPPKQPVNAAQNNKFFDAAISSDLTRAGFITNMKQQISALQNIAGLISARIAATKDVTRRRTLEDQLLGVESQITGDRAQVAQDFLASLQLGVTKAQATATFKDDIASFTALENGIKAQIKATGDTLDLEQQLFDAQQGLAAARNSQRNAAQFKALGLTATGDDVTPGVKKLKSELSTLTGAITGTFLDTSKTQSILAQLSKVLSGGLGVVGQQVRSKVQDIIDGLNNQLKGNAQNLSKFQHVSSEALLAGLGLSPDLEKELRSRISQLGPNGTLPSGRSQAFALAGAGPSPRPVTVESHTTVMLDGKVVAKSVTTQQQKAARRRSVGRRGPFAGRN